MLSFKNIYEFIDFLPKYMIPYEYFDICWYIKIKNNKDFEIITPKEVVINLKEIFGNFSFPKQIYQEKLDNYIHFLRKNPKITFLRSGKILFQKDEIPNHLIECDNCGKIYDGNAQCNCFLFSNEFGEYLCIM